MRRATALPKPPAGQPLAETHLWLTLRTLFPYLWRYRLRVVAALGCLVGAKVANVGVPLVFKQMIDGLSGTQQLLALPVLMLLLYGMLRFSTALFTELREILFARVTQRAVRQVALEVFCHLHALSLRFHLERQTGGVSRDIERGSRSISSLI
ncbi:MAG TPA: ABC transporter transmembrane domain-containing protein, partial [Azonexus sp.]|nr:ABC transporter transmembrane domain-containing protein [Azonexus sp.]